MKCCYCGAKNEWPAPSPFESSCYGCWISRLKCRRDPDDVYADGLSPHMRKVFYENKAVTTLQRALTLHIEPDDERTYNHGRNVRSRGNAGFYDDDASNWQENAIRAMEDNG